MIEQVANRLLSLDAEANQKLVSFEDKVIHIEITDLKLNYYFLFIGGSLVVKEQSERPASASISGKLSAFIAAGTTNSSDAIFTGELHFSGEINTARRFQEFAQSLEIDWQEPLSNIVGDVMSQNIAQGVRQVGQFVGQLFNNARQDIPEYLQHEIQATPTASELNYYFEQVDLTRSQTDRLQARVQRLCQND